MDREVEQYLKRLQVALSGTPKMQVQEIVSELRVHIRERLSTDPGPDAVRATLEALGAPEEIAREYRAQMLLSNARTSYHPWLILKSTLRWAQVRLKGIAVFVLTVIAYVTAAVCIVCALLKPVFPASIGLWAGGNHLILGFVQGGHEHPFRVAGVSLGALPPSFVVGSPGQVTGPLKELLGFWFIPLSFCAGIIIFFAATHVVRHLIQRMPISVPGG